MIYLDNAATTYPKPENVYKALDNAQRNYSFNIGRGSYTSANSAMKFYDDLKKELCDLVKVRYSNQKVILTSSATIASNQLIQGLDIQAYDVVYYSPFEHNAIARPLEQLKKKIGFQMIQIPYSKDQDLMEEEYKHLLAINPATHVFACQVSNVTGLILDIELIFKLAGENSICISDVSQSIGLVNINMKDMHVDYLIFAGHKTLYGPFGIGGIIRKKILPLEPLLFGGTGSDSLNVLRVNDEVGSPNIVAICGLLEGIRWIKTFTENEILNKERELISLLSESLNDIYGIKMFIHKKDKKRTGILAFSLEGLDANEVSEILSEDYKIATRSGYHCSPYVSKLLQGDKGGGFVRISISGFTTREDIRSMVEALEEV